MSWRDELSWARELSSQRKQASFRNANFFVRDTSAAVGRRNVIHQYPFQDTPYIEDMGGDIDDFTIEGYVVQNSDNDQNYFAEKNALISALKEKDSGTLIHPFYGTLTVSLVGKAQILESFNPGGIARFTMNFIRADEATPPFPDKVIDHVSLVDEAIEKALDFGVDGFAAIYDGLGIPDFSSTSTLTSIASLNSMLRAVTASIQGAGPAQISRSLTILSEAYSDVNNLTTIADTCELANGIIGMSNGLLSLIGDYGDIVVSQLLGACSSAVRGIISGPMSGASSTIPTTGGFAGSTLSDPAIIAEDFGKTVTRASLAIDRFGEPTGNDNPSQYGGTLDSINITTASRARQAANQEAIVNMSRLVGLTTATKAAIRIEYTSHDSVVEMMNEVVDCIDNQLLKLGNDAANTDYSNFNITVSDPNQYQALISLRPIFVKSMLGIGASLSDIIEYEVPPTTISSLVLAYDKYEDLDREKEIITRNIPLVKNPGFLPGGQTLGLLDE